MRKHVHVHVGHGAFATVDPDVSEETLKALAELAERAYHSTLTGALGGPCKTHNNSIMGEHDEAQRPLTFGEKAVGIKFNPGGDPEVEACKRGFAVEIDRMNDLRSKSESAEQKRLCSVAITELQGAQMWAVKALTWKD
jgi:hypothetical protein